MRRILILAAFAAFAGSSQAQDVNALRIQVQFLEAKPDAKRLAFYSLDWAMNLKDAKAKAAKEHRPILIVLNTNITAGTNFFSGHT